MKSLVRVAFVAAALCAIATPAFAGNIGVVDLRRAFSETKDGKAALKKLKKEFEKRQAELDRRQKDLLAWKDDIAKRISLMTDETKREKQEEFQKRLGELEQTYKKLQDEMQAREEKLSSPVLEKLQKALAKIADSEGIDIVLQVGPGVVWSRKSLDLTDQLIRQFERMK